MGSQPALTQQDIDHLLEQLSETPSKGGSSFNFGAVSRLVKEHLLTLELVHSQYAQVLSSFLSATMQDRVTVEVGSVSNIALNDLTQSLPNPTVVGSFSLEPLPGICLLELSLDLGFAFLERFFGGRCSYYVPKRIMTDLELRVMERVLRGALDGLQEAWAKVFTVHPALLAVDSNPQLLQPRPTGDHVVRVILKIRLGELMGHMQLALPTFGLEPILDRLSHRTWYGSGGHSDADSKADESEMTRAIDDVEVAITAVLGRAGLPARDVMALSPGSIVVLDQLVSDEVDVVVEGRSRFRGRPCRVGDNLAVRVDRFLDPTEEDIEDSPWAEGDDDE